MSDSTPDLSTTPENAIATDPSATSTPAPVDASPSDETKTADAASTHRIKIDGDVFDVPEDHIRDWATKTFGTKAKDAPIEALIRPFQKHHSAQARFEVAAEKERQMERFFGLLKERPLEVLTHPNLGIDMVKLAEHILAEKVREDMMDPKDRELAKTKRELDERKAAEARRAAEEARLRDAQQDEAQAHEYLRETVEALEASPYGRHSGLAQEMLRLKRLGLQKGADIPAKDLLPRAVKNLQSVASKFLENLPDTELEPTLGGIAERLRKLSLAKVSDLGSVPAQPPPSRPIPTTKSGKISKEEWRRQLEAMRQGAE